MLKNFLIILFFSLVTLPLAYAAKPASALSLSMEWSVPPIKGQVNEFKVTIVSSIPAKDASLEITLPEALQLVDGKVSSHLQIEVAKPVDVVFKVFVPETGNGSIGASVSIGQRGQAYFSANQELPISNAQQQTLKSRNIIKPQYEINERNGVRIREYKLPD